MELDFETTPTALRSAFVASTFRGPVAEVCPQTGLRPVQASITAPFTAVEDAGMATGHRPWSPLIT